MVMAVSTGRVPGRQETPSRQGAAVTIALVRGLRHSVFCMRSNDPCSDGGVSVNRALIPKSIVVRVDRWPDAELSIAREDQRHAGELLVSRPSRGGMGAPTRVGTRAVDDNGTALHA